MTSRIRCGGSRSGGGFTLVEVLVSLVILSIGLLGMAKLMLFSSRSNDSAYLRSQATALAYEILDYMRANRQEALAGTYTTPLNAAAADPGFSCVAIQCNTAQVALFDVYQWKLHLSTPPAGALPQGQGRVITTTVGSQTDVKITVNWDDSVAQGVAGTTQSINLETLL